MNKAIGLLAGVATLLVLAGGPVNAATFSVSDAFGTGSFGEATTQDLGGDTLRVTIEMAPNIIIDTGSHFSATFSLAGIGTVADTLDTLNPVGLFDTNPQTDPASYANSPFGLFTDAITGNCGPGGSVGCGSTLVFDILNFSGFLAATNLYNGLAIFAAVDILNTACVAAGGEACTGVVGLTVAPTPRDAGQIL